MPDADIVNLSLSPKYQKAYKQLCEGYWDKEYIGQSVVKALHKDIQTLGDEPITL